MPEAGGRGGRDPDAPPLALTGLSPERAAQIFSRDPRLLLGVGTLDPLGPRIPLGAGLRIVDEVVKRVSARCGVVHAPTFAYGGVNRSEAGAAGLQRKTLHRAVNDLLGAWEDHGIQEFIVITAQRSEPHMDALLMAFTSEARTTVFDLLSLDIADLVDTEVRERPGGIERRVLAHLDATETYMSGAAATPPDDGIVREGGAVLSRWMALLVDAIPSDPSASAEE